MIVQLTLNVTPEASFAGTDDELLASLRSVVEHSTALEALNLGMEGWASVSLWKNAEAIGSRPSPLAGMGFARSTRPEPDDVEIKASTRDWMRAGVTECLATAYHEYRHVCIMETGEWFTYEDEDQVPELLVALGVVGSLDEIED